MNTAIEKTLSLILIILIGIFFKNKFLKKEDLRGIKTIILSIALPATIFVALLKIKFDLALLFLPLMALCFNFAFLATCSLVLPKLGIPINTPGGRTMMMLIPSLAPGLSCFPYILEYLGKEPLAWAALADVGNKIFVLIFLYLLAMNWYSCRQNYDSSDWKTKIKELLNSLLKEPINLVLIVGLVMVGFGLHFNSMPFFVQKTLDRLSNIMTPMVLLYIGIAVKIKGQQFSKIMLLLLWRMGLSFCLSGIIIFLFPVSSTAMTLLIVIFPLSSCSFWPYAHMSAIDLLEKKLVSSKKYQPLFDLDLAVSILAISLPLSTIIILTVCILPQVFVESSNLLLIGNSLIILTTILLIRNNNLSSQRNQLTVKKKPLQKTYQSKK